MSEPLQRISTLLEKVEWSFALRQTFTTQLLQRQVTMLIVRCEATSLGAISILLHRNDKFVPPSNFYEFSYVN
jgi:hypothetical protein